jgi:hypothetical protein
VTVSFQLGVTGSIFDCWVLSNPAVMRPLRNGVTPIELYQAKNCAVWSITLTLLCPAAFLGQFQLTVTETNSGVQREF